MNIVVIRDIIPILVRNNMSNVIFAIPNITDSISCCTSAVTSVDNRAKFDGALISNIEPIK